MPAQVSGTRRKVSLDFAYAEDEMCVAFLDLGFDSPDIPDRLRFRKRL